MPSTSKSQQRLFCMAYAVRKGKLKRSEVQQNVLDIVDGDMTDKQIKDFMELKESVGLVEFIKESLGNYYNTEYANGMEISFPEHHRRILVIVKPGFLQHTQEIVDKLQAANFRIVNTKTTTLTRDAAKKLYDVHKKEPFYKALVDYMISGPSTAIVIEQRKRIGEERSIKLVADIKEEIREKYGESERLNVMHSSDSYNRAAYEISCYFF